MGERGVQLLETADRQISELIDLFSARGEVPLRLPCPGREKLGDGTVAACASHTADRYQQIAGFLRAASQNSDVHTVASKGNHRVPSFRAARDHARADHAEPSHEKATHDEDYTAENTDLAALLERLSAGRGTLHLLADLTDGQLDAVPAAGSFKFCDGQRTLEQVADSLLRHQGHQVNAMKEAVA